MFQTQTRWLQAAALLAVPLAMFGCGGGGGGGGGSSSPRATATPVGSATATPTTTAVSAPTVFNINASLSQVSGALPFAVKYTNGTADISTQLGYNIVTARFGQDNTPGAQPAFFLDIGTLGTIKTGDSFAFANSSIGLGDKNLTFNDLRDASTFRQYNALSGTFRVNSLVNNPATTTQNATTTVSFTLTNVILHDQNNVGSPDLRLNATGQFTAQNIGNLAN